MRNLLAVLFTVFLISTVAGCSDDATQPAAGSNDRTVQGEIGDSDFEFTMAGPGEPGDPLYGPYLLRGGNLHYDEGAHELIVDLTVVNHGSFPVREPIGLTFIKLDPDGVAVINSDNDIHDDGAAITFHFTNDDALWTPGETSIRRPVRFDVDAGVSIAFVARLDLGDVIDGGAIAGRVWNDANENGVMENDEEGIPGVGLYLNAFTDDPDTTVTREFGYTESDQDGRYAFRNLAAGGYVVSSVNVTKECRPTTPTEIHVLLVEVNGEVSSYRGANFGCVRLRTPPPFGIGERLRATGKFYEPDMFATFSVEQLVCPEDSVPPPVTNTPPDPECAGARLRGPVTHWDASTGALKVMNTWLLTGNIKVPEGIAVGSRVDVHFHAGPGPTSWMLDSIARWDGPRDELNGRVEAVEPAADGTIRVRVLDLWLMFPVPVPGGS